LKPGKARAAQLQILTTTLMLSKCELLNPKSLKHIKRVME